MAENCNRDTNTRNSTGCKALQKRLQMIDFALVDTILYLDAYPECSQALEYYHILLEQKDEISNAIIAQCGPITACDNASTDSWDWTRNPWPWQYDAN